MTTPQLGELFFTGKTSRVAQRRLQHLFELRLVDRFQPPSVVWGIPWHWTLSAAGAKVLAQAQGMPVERLGHPSRLADRLRRSPQLGHAVGLSLTYVAFSMAARATSGAKIERWWPTGRCKLEWGHHVRPDGYVRWRQRDRMIDAFIEYDTGTESHRRLIDKIARYRALAEASQLASTVLFVVPSTRRMSNLCLGASPGPHVRVHVTTERQLAYEGPTRAVWREVGDANCTLRTLTELS